MYEAVRNYLKLTEAEVAFLKTIETQMGIVADLSRADVLLYGRYGKFDTVILAHAQPHSIAHVYSKSQVGRKVKLTETRQEIIKQALLVGRRKEQGGYISEGAPVVKKTFPIYYPPLLYGQNRERKPRIIAALVVVTNLLEHERLRLRSKVFRRAIKKLQDMVWRGELNGAARLSSFGEQDGIVFVDKNGIIRYVSGVASNLYRKLGYKDTMVGRPLAEIETADEELRKQALAENQCLEQEINEADRIWIRKVLPLVSYTSPLRYIPFIRYSRAPKKYGVLITLHDATQIRRQDQELRIKNAMIQEVHHRVKNNLQTIAGLIRMQTRRTQSDEARAALTETQQRILSIAVIHEFLSNESSNIINVKEVCQKIVTQLQYGVMSPDQNIVFDISGDKISIPPRQATACSLIMNEVLQNAIEHGFEGETEGLVRINLEDTGDEAIISVVDNGHGVSENFSMDQNQNLGLQIVRTLVENDLQGRIKLDNNNSPDKGLAVTITFPKIVGG